MPAPSLTIVVGKGGVGRSTVARAYAIAASQHGLRSLYVALDVAGRQGKPSGQHIAPDVTASRWLETRTLYGAAAVETIATPLFGSQRVARSMLGNFAIQRLLDVVPAIREYALLAAAMELTTQYDQVVMDMPATGHGMAWLGAAGRLATLLPSGPTRDQALHVQSALRDPAMTRIIAVTLAEALVLAETKELRAALVTELHRDVDHIVVNRAPIVPLGAMDQANAIFENHPEMSLHAVEVRAWLKHQQQAQQQASDAANGIGVTWINDYRGNPPLTEIARTLAGNTVDEPYVQRTSERSGAGF